MCIKQKDKPKYLLPYVKSKTSVYTLKSYKKIFIHFCEKNYFRGL